MPAKRKLDDAGQTMSRQPSNDKDPVSDAPSASAPLNRKAFRLKRSGSSSSNTNAPIRPVAAIMADEKQPSDTPTASSRRRSSGQSSQPLQDASDAAQLVADDHISPLAALPSPAEVSKVAGSDAEVTNPHQHTRSPPAISIQDWPPEKFRKLSSIARQQATVLKRSGDNKMRELAMQQQQLHQHARRDSAGSSSSMLRSDSHHTLSPDKLLALSLPLTLPPGMPASIPAFFEHVDAIVLYAFGFWADDYAAGQHRARSVSVTQSASANSESWRIGCIIENWRSMSGLLTFVKAKAEKLQAQATAAAQESVKPANNFDMQWPRVIELLVAWL